MEYARQQGYETTGILYEYYLNDPGEDPAIEPQTEIRLPLKSI